MDGLAEVLFYHLSQSRLEDALPGLVERSLKRQWRVVIRFSTCERLSAIDQRLWTYSDDSFLAHSQAEDQYQAEQPVFLTLDDNNPNKAQVCFCVEGTELVDPSQYHRLVVMFDGDDIDQLNKARSQWKQLKETENQLTYWQQSATGRWEKKA